MTDTRRVAGIVLLWAGVVTAAHLRLNFDWSSVVNGLLPEATRRLNVAYLPVT